jgi:multiple sugar transport system substrate-binding protein
MRPSVRHIYYLLPSRLITALIITALLPIFAVVQTTQAQDQVTVSWSVWGSPEELASHQRVADAFMEEHPDIAIEIRHTPWDDYHENLKRIIATGDPAQIPDIMWLGQDFERYYRAGMLENLTPYIEATDYPLDDYWTGLIDRATLEGGVYGLQRDLDLRLLYYNKDIFDAEGVEYPTDEWTWDEWREAAEALTEREGNTTVRYGLAMETRKWDMLLLQNGGSVLDDIFNPSECRIDTPQSVLAAEFFADLLNRGLAMRQDELDEIGGDAEAFLQGKAAMIIQNGSRAPTFNAAGLNYDVAPIPIPRGGERVNNNDGARFVMSSRSLNKDAAWTFLSWLQSAEGGLRIYTENGEIFPALKSLAESESFLGLEIAPANREAFNIEASGGRYLVLGDFPDWGELNDTVVTPGLDLMWTGEARPRDVISNMCDRVNEFLQIHGYPK